MKRVKKYLKIVGVSLLVFMMNNACDEYFPEPIEKFITQDTIFNSPLNAEKLLNSAYYQVPFNWPYSWNSENSLDKSDRLRQNILANITDESICGSTWTGAPLFYYGECLLNADNVGRKSGSSKMQDRRSVEHLFEDPYVFFNRAFTFIENVGNTRGASEQWIKETKAQAQILNAIGYYELIRRYGSVPWVDHVLLPNEVISEERPPLKDIIEWVDAWIVEAIPNLPESYNETNQGRITRAAAHALRSRLWLLAASPLFNSASPYMDNGEGNHAIWMGGYDASLWQKAANVTREAIEYCEGAGYALVSTGNPVSDYTTGTRDLIGNSELILFSRRVTSWSGDRSGGYLYGRYLPPRGAWTNNATGWANVTQNMVALYETTDGSDVNLRDDNPWEKLDPRFHASIVHDKGSFGGSVINANLYKSMNAPVANPVSNSALQNGWMTGFYMRKFLHEEQYSNSTLRFDASYPYMRLPELYLSYAEALNEVSPGHGDIAANLNKLRARAGMPNVPSLGQDEMRELIRNERTIELIFEDQRFFDVKRWKIADQTIGGTKYGIHRINEDDVANGLTDENGVAYEFGDYMVKECPANRQRIWNDRLYLMPFPRYEINKGKGLVQNPGY